MDELRVVITADASGVGAGVAQATAAVQSSADQIAVAQQKATAATKLLTEAQVQLGAAAAAGNAQAKLIIAGYAAASAEAAVAVEELTGAVAAQTPIMAENAAATSAAAAATQVLGVSSRQGAAAGIGILEGRMMSGNRAAAAFLSTTLGLGPAIQAAFPIIGALALGEVLINVGKHAYDLYEKFIDISAVDDKLLADFKKMQETDVLNVHSIETATERLDEATASATNLRGAADALHKTSMSEIFADIAGGNTMGAATDVALLVGAKKLAEEGGKQTEDSIKLGLIRLKQEHELALEKIDSAHAADGMLGKEQQITAEQEKRLAIIRENKTYERNEERALGNLSPTTAGDSLAAQKEAQAASEAAVARYNDQVPILHEIAQLKIEAAHADDAGLAPAEQIIAAMDKQVELNDLKARSSRDGTEAERELARILENELALSKAKEQLDTLGTEQRNRDFEEQLKADQESFRQEGEAQKQAVEEENRLRDVKIAGVRDAAQATIEAATLDFQITQEQIRAQEQLGIISHRVAEQRLQDALATRETATQGALKSEQGLYDPALGEKQKIEYDKLQEEITNDAKKASAERQRIADQEAVKIEQIYKKVATTFNTDFDRAFNEWATKSKTAGQAFGHMLGQMELQVIDFVAKWILEKTEMWAMDKVLQATGLAQQKAVQAAANTATVASDAGVAAAGTMAYWSAINPIIAPAMAAVAYSETMAYAGASLMDAGGMMPHMGFAFNASGSAERVLSPSQTSNFESLVNNGGARSATLHQTNHFGGGVTEDMLAAHTAQTMAKMRGMLRPEAFK